MTAPLLVLGGRGVVAPVLLELARDGGRRVAAVSRGDPGVPGVGWLRADLAAAVDLPAGYGHVVHAAPLGLLPGHLDALAGAGASRIVAFSSTSVHRSRAGADPDERQAAARLTAAERTVAEHCGRRGLELTLLRPTMVYGFGRDRNVSRIAATVRRLRFFPVAGPASGCRQPVHALDVADAALRALDAPATAGGTYTLSGAERLPFAELVARVCRGLGMQPRVVHVPARVYGALAGAAGRMGLGVGRGTAIRMNEDQCFDHGAAARHLGFRPAPFLEDPARDLPR